jgi:hypothetical protein
MRESINMLSYENIKNKPKLLRAMTTLNKDEFEDLCGSFEEAWDKYNEEAGGHDRSKGGRKPVLEKIEEKLFFILFYVKLYPLQEVFGYLFGMSQSQANYWIHVLSEVLKMALQCNEYLPQRDPEKMEDKLRREASDAIAIDGTERRCQRPLDNEEQNFYYSGKKKAHTLKNDLIVGINDMEIKYLSGTYEGKAADKKIIEEEELSYPEGIHVYQDKGLEGYKPAGVIIHQPKKKPKGEELSSADKEQNRLISRVRVVVEHVIACIKRCRIVKDVFRNNKEDYDDLVMEIACGLHNLRRDYRLQSY